MSRLPLPLLILFVALSAHAGDLPSGSSAGQILFQTYCATCHGINADGMGPVAAELKTPPPDLTRLADRHGLPLPKDKIAEFIDGRSAVAAHGSREMPVWGDQFFRSSPPGSTDAENAKRRAIAVIVEYLESIQRLRESRACDGCTVVPRS